MIKMITDVDAETEGAAKTDASTDEKTGEKTDEKTDGFAVPAPVNRGKIASAASSPAPVTTISDSSTEPSTDNTLKDTDVTTGQVSGVSSEDSAKVNVATEAPACDSTGGDTEMQGSANVKDDGESGAKPDGVGSGSVSAENADGDGSSTVSAEKADGEGSSTESVEKADGESSGAVSAEKVYGEGSSTVSAEKADGEGPSTVSAEKADGECSGSVSTEKADGEVLSSSKPADAYSSSNGDTEMVTDSSQEEDKSTANNKTDSASNEQGKAVSVGEGEVSTSTVADVGDENHDANQLMDTDVAEKVFEDKQGDSQESTDTKFDGKSGSETAPAVSEKPDAGAKNKPDESGLYTSNMNDVETKNAQNTDATVNGAQEDELTEKADEVGGKSSDLGGTNGPKTDDVAAVETSSGTSEIAANEADEIAPASQDMEIEGPVDKADAMDIDSTNTQ
ncbi:hypothetical protein, variant [Sphaeroforma arctica JP610]|uniref:Uncharacterized protein n=1 Tax=Sphaeroforma arctica JP610 TaxID=667725 RepID=A0A0L0F8N8_9EUKA|nr:hypothetical protein, variant [Sphaeroforma arctica JP610]KNC73070.1 hypothetical protein, variant [Sphaeroforma arctica JP610]|eukprot:XP_014146972.1 hypothetical protein, variant [Sphaeroforma arctica JP610]